MARVYTDNWPQQLCANMTLDGHYLNFKTMRQLKLNNNDSNKFDSNYRILNNTIQYRLLITGDTDQHDIQVPKQPFIWDKIDKDKTMITDYDIGGQGIGADTNKKYVIICHTYHSIKHNDTYTECLSDTANKQLVYKDPLVKVNPNVLLVIPTARLPNNYLMLWNIKYQKFRFVRIYITAANDINLKSINGESECPVLESIGSTDSRTQGGCRVPQFVHDMATVGDNLMDQLFHVMDYQLNDQDMGHVLWFNINGRPMYCTTPEGQPLSKQCRSQATLKSFIGHCFPTTVVVTAVDNITATSTTTTVQTSGNLSIPMSTTTTTTITESLDDNQSSSINPYIVLAIISFIVVIIITASIGAVVYLNRRSTQSATSLAKDGRLSVTNRSLIIESIETVKSFDSNNTSSSKQSTVRDSSLSD
ncbi:uncharacterized protein LOC128956631 [Oppia nitens]|uniref:uncharacterized protein LOC128956631 n=1 Tax=Oppia nitens TaxID=1686743 RepID=UPI0023DAFCD3|nr:uncharacterized protein LOC128956631 [Oppia nitens]